MPAHTGGPIRADLFLFDGTVPTVWLQHRLWDGPLHLHWYDYLSWLVYLSHFFATLVAAAALWLFAHHRFRRYVAMVSLLAAMGFATYVLYPAVPPWLAAADGDLAHVGRIVGPIWAHVSYAPVPSLFEKGQHFANNVAAMPSLHAAYAMLLALYLWRAARWPWRIPLALYPPAMAFALVYTAEHYMIDVLAGWAYAVVAFAAVHRAADALAARRAYVSASGAP